MAEVNLVIHGRNYTISCDDGQEQRLMDLANNIDQRMKEISKSGAANNEMHLLVLTSLIMADEIFDLKENLNQVGQHAHEAGESFQQQEVAIANAIDHLADRIDYIAERVQKA